MASLKVSESDRRWEVEDAMRTLQRAQQIQKDKSLMSDVKKSVSEMAKMVNRVQVKKPSAPVSKKSKK